MKPEEFHKIAPNPKTEEEMFLMLMKVALENKHMGFEFIRNWEMRKLCKHQLRGLKQVLKFFEAAIESAQDKWRWEIQNNKIDFGTPIMIKELEHCWAYYKIELDNIKEMLKEHREYMFSFHLLDTFVLNRWRPDNECYDHRRLFKKK